MRYGTAAARDGSTPITWTPTQETSQVVSTCDGSCNNARQRDFTLHSLYVRWNFELREENVIFIVFSNILTVIKMTRSAACISIAWVLIRTTLASPGEHSLPRSVHHCQNSHPSPPYSRFHSRPQQPQGPEAEGCAPRPHMVTHALCEISLHLFQQHPARLAKTD